MEEDTIIEKLEYIRDEKVNKIIPENIKSGVEILNITGDYQADITTSPDYIRCLNLTELILGNEPIMDDPHITMLVNLNMTASQQVSVDGTSLVITTNS